MAKRRWSWVIAFASALLTTKYLADHQLLTIFIPVERSQRVALYLYPILLFLLPIISFIVVHHDDLERETLGRASYLMVRLHQSSRYWQWRYIVQLLITAVGYAVCYAMVIVVYCSIDGVTAWRQIVNAVLFYIILNNVMNAISVKYSAVYGLFGALVCLVISLIGEMYAPAYSWLWWTDCLRSATWHGTVYLMIWCGISLYIVRDSLQIERKL